MGASHGTERQEEEWGFVLWIARLSRKSVIQNGLINCTGRRNLQSKADQVQGSTVG